MDPASSPVITDDTQCHIFDVCGEPLLPVVPVRRLVAELHFIKQRAQHFPQAFQLLHTGQEFSKQQLLNCSPGRPFLLLVLFCHIDLGDMVRLPLHKVGLFQQKITGANVD